MKLAATMQSWSQLGAIGLIFFSLHATSEVQAAGTSASPAGWSRSISIAVGELFTVYTGKSARVEVSDGSIVGRRQADPSNLVIQGRKVGRTTLWVWNTAVTVPARFEITVTPRTGAIGPADSAGTETIKASGGMERGVDPSIGPIRFDADEDRLPLTLYVGSVVTRKLGDVSRVVVGNEGVLKVSTLDDGSLLLLGLAPGVSELDAWTLDDVHVKHTVRVYQTPPSDALQLVNVVLAEYPDVAAEEELGRVFVRGTVDAVRFEGFDKVMRNFPGVINLVRPEINVEVENGIALDVAVLEVNRNYQRNVGIRWQDTAAGPAVGVVGNLHRNSLIGVVSDVGNRQELQTMLGAVGSGTQRLSGYLGITSIFGSELQLLQEEGYARVLAAPSLATVSGTPARFLAGGDLPVAVLNEFGQPVVEFREFGVKLEIEPVADRLQNIRAKILAEVSSVDFSVQVNGVPGLLRRQTTSTITARPGETIVLSGLLDARDTRSADKLPGLGDIPVIGALFRSKDFIQQRTELVVTVTLRIQRADTPVTKGLQAAEAHLRKVLRGGDQINASFME